jgi:hypothetical protein
MEEKQPRDRQDEENKATDEEIWLLGQPPLQDYLEFVEDMVVGGATLDRAALTDEWRAANDYYHELEQHEAGIADEVECQDLDPALAPLAAEVTADPRYRRAFDTLPTSLGMVELDRLVTYQKSVTRNFIEALKSRLGPDPDPETLFRFSLPFEHPDAPVQIRRVGSRRYVFRSNSMDLRSRKSVLLRPDQIRDCHSLGPVVGVVGLVVGFSSNFLNAIRHEKRLLLYNGYHRACALREQGVTHAPCVIRTVTRMDELQVAADREITDDAGFYFDAPRPPLLKDFFDPKIRKLFSVHKMERMIEVNFEVREYTVQE